MTDYFDAEVSETAMIAPTACIVGAVKIGAEVTFMHAVAARGDYGGRVEIGDFSNVQENCCLHVDRDGLCKVGAYVTVGHGAILHGCTIGDYSLVGMGATVLDGAVVGSHVLIGAGALVTGTARIPDGMLVIGSPARAVRALTPEEIQRIAAGADEYQAVGHEMTAQGLLYSGRSEVAAHCPGVALKRQV